MTKILEEIRDGLRDGIELVADKTEEYTKIGKIQVDILKIKRDTDKMIEDLGRRTLEILKKDPNAACCQDQDTIHLVEALKKLEIDLEAKNAEIKAIKDAKEKERRERSESRKKDKTGEQPAQPPESGE